MNDYLLRVSAADGMIRGFFANTKETVDCATAIHQTSAVMAAALGRLLTAGAMMGVMLKDDHDLLTLRIKGDGPAGGLIVTANRQAQIRGYAANPQADVPNKTNGKLNVSGVIGSGYLTVTKAMGFGEPYSSTIALQSGEIAEDFTYYFAQSEQTPSAVALGVLVDTDYHIKQAGGFIIQLMPGASESCIRQLEEKLASLESITSLYEQGHTPETLIDLLFQDMGYHIMDRLPISFHCNCSRERTERALISIGRQELESILEEDGKASVQCHFCNETYEYGDEALKALIHKTSF